ncbi:hypothetical protein uvFWCGRAMDCOMC429_029 [Freshwater phage uvFW-CGR-AMD-COM-C429]|nr:hypothetical protein uvFWCGRAMDCOMC429_029 [Freshwater phage uvFW-CGR-AMD-COM-C429]
MAATEPIKPTAAGFEAFKNDWRSKGSNSTKTFTPKLNQQLWEDYVKDISKKNSEAAGEKADAPLSPQEEKIQSQEFLDAFAEADASNMPQVDKTKYKTRAVNLTPANLAAGAIKYGVNMALPGSGVGRYSGSNLTDESGNVASRGIYDTSPSGSDAANVYYEIINKDKTGAAITEFLETLRNYQYYGDSKPSELAKSKGGVEAKDLNAIAAFLDRSNNSMLTWKAELINMKKGPAVGSSGSGTAPSYSSREDMASYLRSAAFKNLGRALTQQEMDTAIKNIRAGQVAASGAGGVTAATLTNSSEAAVQTAAPGEAAAYGLGAALDILFKKHGAK